MDAPSVHAAVHALVASLFESVDGLPSFAVDSTVSQVLSNMVFQRSEHHSIEKILGVRGGHEVGALRIGGSDEPLDDPESLTSNL